MRPGHGRADTSSHLRDLCLEYLAIAELQQAESAASGAGDENTDRAVDLAHDDVSPAGTVHATFLAMKINSPGYVEPYALRS